MKGTEKNHTGKIVVLIIVAAALLGTGLTWMKYAPTQPATLDARIISPNAAEATFPAEESARIRPGMKATVSFGESRYTGFVTAAPDSSRKNFLIELRGVTAPLTPGTICQVTVDTSVPPELWKEGPAAN